MDDIQADVSDNALIIAIRANMCDFFRYSSRSNSKENYEDEGFTRWYSPLSHPWFNGVLSSHLPKDHDETFINNSLSYFRNKGVNTITWWMEPHLKRADWESMLSKHGFGFSDDTPGMAVDLREINESIQPISGFEIREVKDEESMRIWGNIFVNGYGLPPDWETAVVDQWMKLGLDFPVRNYLGYLNGNPVSTSMIFYGGGCAGIYCVATLPAARGKGIGTAITLKPLQDARDKGYRIGTLQSSDMGFSVYKKLGFRHLCQIEYFYLSL